MPRARLIAAAMVAGCGAPVAAPDARPAPDAASYPRTLDGNRERLLASYWARLRSIPDVVQANGLRGADLADVCALWSALAPSARATFLTLTHRLEGAALGDDSRALDHALLLYRIDGGAGATAGDPGSCGGGESNRAFFSTDTALHDALVAIALADLAPHPAWRASSDAAGPHAPFDASDETEDGAPRGQVQFFTTGAAAAARPLGRADVTDVIDPFALEMDQDYDCVHSSNPLCSYTFYGPACAPESTSVGADIYKRNYGDFVTTWTPAGC